VNIPRVAGFAAAVLCVSCAPAGAGAGSNLHSILASFESDAHGDLHSVILIQNGEVLAERYYNGGDRQTRVDVMSAAKSVTSLLLGIAVDQGAIESL
jgi:hypothetical protein